MVRSDGDGSYLNGVDCVSVAISGNLWQRRTVANTGICNGEAQDRTRECAEALLLYNERLK